MSYDIGDLITISAVITDAAGGFVDPSKLYFYYLDPAGGPAVGVKGHSATPYIYGTDPEIVQDSSGHYHIDLPIPEDVDGGNWFYRWRALSASDVARGAKEGSFRVKASAFV